MLAVVGALLSVTLAGLGWAGALMARQRAEAAADLAALAGAAALQTGGAGCAEAERVVAANAPNAPAGADHTDRAARPVLASCRVAGSHVGLVVEVVVSVPVEVFGVEVSPALGRARAGVAR